MLCEFHSLAYLCEDLPIVQRRGNHHQFAAMYNIQNNEQLFFGLCLFYSNYTFNNCTMNNLQITNSHIH